MAERVVAEARNGPRVVVLQPGSAIVVDTVTQLILDEAEPAGFVVRIIPGISSVEAVLSEIGYDLAAGIQIILTQKLLLHDIRLDRAQAALLLQPGYYDTTWYGGLAKSQPHRFKELEHYLLKYYEPETRMALILVGFQLDVPGRTLWFKLNRLGGLYARISPFDSLFIPPDPPSQGNPQWRKRISSWPRFLEGVSCDPMGRPVQLQMADFLKPETDAGYATLDSAGERRCQRSMARMQAPEPDVE
jgi:hypothetical protein